MSSRAVFGRGSELETESDGCLGRLGRAISILETAQQ